MFGIGGSEIFFILVVVLMLFGSKNIPTMARTLGKTFAQIKNATNEIKNEIQKSADETGVTKSMKDLNEGFQKEVNSIKEDVATKVPNPIDEVKEDLENLTGPIKRQF